MPLEKHDLLHELPEYKDRIHELKISDKHFAKIFAEYHEVDHEIHRIEEGIETPSDEYVEELKKKRLLMKDELFAMLQA
ncbi:MAG: YdcH family protein [Gammaproteobacteria bacterium]